MVSLSVRMIFFSYNLVWDFTSIIFVAYFSWEINFLKHLNEGKIQGFSNFTELPPMLLSCSVQKYSSLLSEISQACPHLPLNLDLLFPSSVILSCSVWVTVQEWNGQS